MVSTPPEWFGGLGSSETGDDMTASDLFRKVERRAKKTGFDMSDPDYVEMQIEAAMYAYASLNHSGQSSELYEVLSTSHFGPGPMWRESDEESENEFYPIVAEVCERDKIK